MNTRKLYVIDTTALISFYPDIFNDGQKISKEAIKIIDKAFDEGSDVRLSIPAIVFVELFVKWYSNVERAARIRYEIFEVIKDKPNIEIKPFEKEVLENFIQLEDDIINLENHDKIILASAMMLECPLITNDRKIIRYVNKHKNVIPGIIS